MRIVLGVGGGIAAYKAASLLRLMTEAGHEVTVVPTAHAEDFVGRATWEALSGRPVSTDTFDDVDQDKCTIAETRRNGNLRREVYMSWSVDHVHDVRPVRLPCGA